MTISNLAIVFGPNILFKNELSSMSLDIPGVKLVEIMIKNINIFFDSPDDRKLAAQQLELTTENSKLKNDKVILEENIEKLKIELQNIQDQFENLKKEKYE